MLQNVFQVLVDRVPFLQKKLWKFWYGLAAKIDSDKFNLRFMNFGYASLEGEGKTIDLEGIDEKHRYSIQLYLKTLSATSLSGKDVLEVGSGRGGGAAAVMKYLPPRSFRAMDLSAKAIELSRAHYDVPGLTFHVGSADDIPFADDSFDCVVNVESSHCYPNLSKFFSEVKRVLRGGGVFCYSDFRKRGELEGWLSAVGSSGLVAMEEADIGKNVLRALELDSERKRLIIERDAPRFLRSAFMKFACVEGSGNFRSLASGEWVYYRFLLGKEGLPSRA